jgi:alditol oxidase
MNKRTFLKTSGAFITSSMLSRLAADEEQGARRTNWAGNYQYRAGRLYVPESVEEVRKIVKSCSKLKALGTRHSFNGIADSTGDQVSLKNLNQMALGKQPRPKGRSF